jgi:hypothetical protein
MAMRLASQYQYQNLRRWFDLKNLVVQDEIDFLRYPQDIVALRGEDQGWLFHKIKEANSSLFTDKHVLTSVPNPSKLKKLNF